jgi:hypothetical protein
VADWGGKVAAWFAGVTVASATLAALIAATAKQPFHGWLRAVFIILVIIAGVSFIMLLLTGPRAAWAAWRNRKAVGLGPDRRSQAAVTGGNVINTVNGGVQYGPVLQGGDFTGLTLGPRAATPTLDPGEDRDSSS